MIASNTALAASTRFAVSSSSASPSLSVDARGGGRAAERPRPILRGTTIPRLDVDADFDAEEAKHEDTVVVAITTAGIATVCRSSASRPRPRARVRPSCAFHRLLRIPHSAPNIPL